MGGESRPLTEWVDMQYKIRCLVNFSDFTILPKPVKMGQEITVSENVYKRLIGSGGKFQILETIAPPVEKVEKRGKA